MRYYKLTFAALALLLAASQSSLGLKNFVGAGNALRLDGESGFVQVPADDDLFMADSRFTLEAWIYVESLIPKKQNNVLGTEQYGLDLTGGGVQSCCYDLGPRTVRSIDLGQWHHLAYVSTGKGQPHRLYVDGVLEREMREVGRKRDLFPRPFHLGSASSNSGFDGQLDEVRVWNRPLSQEEIRAHMNTSLTGVEEGLAGYYTFDALDDFGRVPDLSGGEHHGEIVNSVDLIPSSAPVNTGWAGPLLHLSQDALAVDWRPQTHFISFENAGEGALDWVVEEGADWLDISWVRGSNAADGRLEDGGRATLAFYTSGRGLAPGEHEARVTIRSNGGDVELPVRLRRDDRPLPILDSSDGPGLALNMIAGLVEVPVTAGLQGLVELTFEAWVRPQRYTKDAGIITLGTATSERFTMVLAGSATGLYWQSNWYPGNLFPYRHTGFSTPIFEDTFQHLALTVAGEDCRLYLDGELVEEQTCGPLLRTDPAYQLFIGRQPHRRDPHFNGLMDEFRLWDRALSGEEIRAHMYRSRRGDEDHLIVYYTFDGDPASKVIPDLSGNGNDGLLRAVATLKESTAPVNLADLQPVLNVDVAAISVGDKRQTKEILLTNAGPGALEWTVAEVAPWLWVEGETGDTRVTGSLSGRGRAKLKVHTVGRGLQAGLYEAQVVVNSNGGRIEVPVQLNAVGNLSLTVAETRVDSATAAAIAWPNAFAIPVEEVLQISMDEARIRALEEVGETLSFKNFRFVGTSPTGLLYAAVDPWREATWPAEGPQFGTHLLRSANGGLDWETLVQGIPWIFCTNHMRLHQVASDPQNPAHVLSATGDGLFRDNEALGLPPQAQSVTALAVDPQKLDIFYIAAERVVAQCEYNERALSLPGLFRGTFAADGTIAWQDFTTPLIAAIDPVEALAVDPQNSDALYLRSPSGAIFHRVLRQETYGWEAINADDIPPYVSLETPDNPIEPHLRVQPNYSRNYVPRTLDLHMGFAGFLFGRDGILYDHTRGEFSHMKFRDVRRSIDGGLSWRNIGSFSSFDPEPAGDALDGRGYVFIAGTRLTGVRALGVGPWTLDPVDPLTLYALQWGRGRLFRTQDSGQSWEMIATPFPPDLAITGLGVDSLATVYLNTADGYFRKRQEPHSYYLDAVQVHPAALAAGQTFLLNVRLIPLTDATPAGRMIAEHQGRHIPLRDDGLEGDRIAGDHVYSALLTTPEAAQPGFHRIPVWFEIDGRPLARSSMAAVYGVGPERSIPIYAEGAAADWTIESAGGLSEPESSARAYRGRISHKIEGAVDYFYQGEPLYAFGYVVEFYLYADADRPQISIDDAKVDIDLEKGKWKRVELAAELLRAHPEFRSDASGEDKPFPLPISSLRFNAQQSVFIDEVQLRAIAVQTPTAIVETENRPTSFDLVQNFPNPFNARTTISYQIPSAGGVQLTLFNTSGQRVRELVDAPQAAGVHRAVWDGTDDLGRPAGSGVYFYRLRAGALRQTRRLVLIK